MLVPSSEPWKGWKGEFDSQEGVGAKNCVCYAQSEEIPRGSQNCTPKCSRLGQPAEIEHKGTKVPFVPKKAAARQVWIPKIHDGSSRSKAREQRFQTIQDDSIQFKTQGRRFNTIQYDSRPKAGDSNYDSMWFQRFNTIQYDSRATLRRSICSVRSSTIHNFYSFQYQWYSQSTTNWACRWLEDRQGSSQAQAQGLLVGGRFRAALGNTYNYLYKQEYDYDNNRNE